MKRTLSASIYQISGVNGKKKKRIGFLGENIAVAFLQQEDHEILCRNIRFEKTEIDIISKNKNEIYFHEVKTRQNAQDCIPATLISDEKISRMHRAAELWQADQHSQAIVIFSLICIELNTQDQIIHYFPDIF